MISTVKTYVMSLAGNPASFLVRSGGGRVYRVWGENTGADMYAMLFDALTVPADGTAPKAECVMQGSFEWNLNLGPGLDCNTGILIVFSSTAKTLTVVANSATSCYVQAAP